MPGNASGDQQMNLNSVACASGTCLAIGTYLTASVRVTPFLISGSASSWSAIEAPLPPNLGDNPHIYGVPAVTCARNATTCVAVGSFPDQVGNYQGLLITGPP
jgi:hypothetical protein